MGLLSKIGGFLFGGSNTVEKGLELADKYIIDQDKKITLVADVIKGYIESGNTKTIPWVDALHKMGRQLMQFGLIGFYAYAWHTGKPLPIEELAILATGPGIYTLLKGKGA